METFYLVRDRRELETVRSHFTAMGPHNAMLVRLEVNKLASGAWSWEWIVEGKSAVLACGRTWVSEYDAERQARLNDLSGLDRTGHDLTQTCPRCDAEVAHAVVNPPVVTAKGELIHALLGMLRADEMISEGIGSKSDQAMVRIAAIDAAKRAIELAKAKGEA